MESLMFSTDVKKAIDSKQSVVILSLPKDEESGVGSQESGVGREQPDLRKFI